MIGSAVTRFLSERGVHVTEVNRTGQAVVQENEAIKFDVLTDEIGKLIGNFSKGTTLINFIGLIRHKIDLQSENSVAAAKKVNSIFPQELTRMSKSLDINVIQIATDCIFSGRKGKYSERSIPDPIDVYGETKLNGELLADNLLTLRVSIVGNEMHHHIELMDWVMHQRLNAEILGFKNHSWNGITSLHFGKIIYGILQSDFFNAGTFHIVPEASISKFQLVSLIAGHAQRYDLNIKEFEAEKKIDRTLATDYLENNSMLWEMAGYESPPTIDFMLEEYFEWASRK